MRIIPDGYIGTPSYSTVVASYFSLSLSIQLFSILISFEVTIISRLTATIQPSECSGTFTPAGSLAIRKLKSINASSLLITRPWLFGLCVDRVRRIW